MSLVPFLSKIRILEAIFLLRVEGDDIEFDDPLMCHTASITRCLPIA